MRVLACGGRYYDDADRVYLILDQLHKLFGIKRIIHGAASGADTLAKEWAIKNSILDEPFPANWGRYGKAAGPFRNQKMLNEGQPHVVVAFPGGRGTANMIKQAEKHGIPVAKLTELQLND